MAGSSLLVLIDDIATVLDDVALMTKPRPRKPPVCWETTSLSTPSRLPV